MTLLDWRIFISKPSRKDGRRTSTVTIVSAFPSSSYAKLEWV